MMKREYGKRRKKQQFPIVEPYLYSKSSMLISMVFVTDDDPQIATTTSFLPIFIIMHTIRLRDLIDIPADNEDDPGDGGNCKGEPC